mmetsp:Transcript_33238/g.80714  ORF Transcript_33238/g.80714 Transcript_33238/m.80714 type:complete len:200 (-) Transcript_33238:461-1060(-)
MVGPRVEQLPQQGVRVRQKRADLRLDAFPEAVEDRNALRVHKRRSDPAYVGRERKVRGKRREEKRPREPDRRAVLRVVAPTAPCPHAFVSPSPPPPPFTQLAVASPGISVQISVPQEVPGRSALDSVRFDVESPPADAVHQGRLRRLVRGQAPQPADGERPLLHGRHLDGEEPVADVRARQLVVERPLQQVRARGTGVP